MFGGCGDDGFRLETSLMKKVHSAAPSPSFTKSAPVHSISCRTGSKYVLRKFVFRLGRYFVLLISALLEFFSSFFKCQCSIFFTSCRDHAGPPTSTPRPRCFVASFVGCFRAAGSIVSHYSIIKSDSFRCIGVVLRSRTKYSSSFTIYN